MQIQFNYANFDQSDALEAHAKKELDHHVGRFSERVTRVEVHFHDESSPHKRTPNDKKCLLEARPAGLNPFTVEDRDDDIFVAVKNATKKLQRVLEKKLDHD